MRRVSIIGCSGSGKSRLAVELGSLLGLPVVHLDAVHWRPGWERPPKEEWRRRHGEFLRADAWILDGNYGGTMEERIAASDTVILLAPSRATCLIRAFRRSLRRWGRRRPDLAPGCREQLPSVEFLRWIWSYNRTHLPSMLRRLEEAAPQKSVVILRSDAGKASWTPCAAELLRGGRVLAGQSMGKSGGTCRDQTSLSRSSP